MEKESKLNKKWIGGIAGLSVLILLIGGSFVWYRLNLGKILPGTYVGGVDVGGLDLDEAKIVIGDELTDYAQQKMVFAVGEKKAVADYVELGTLVDMDSSLAKVEVVDDAADFKKMVGGLVQSNNHPLEFVVDHQRVRKFLEKKFSLNLMRAANAQLQVDRRGKLMISPERKGKIVKYESLINQLEPLLGQMATVSLVLEFEAEKPMITRADLEVYRSRWEQMLTQKINLVLDDQKWPIFLKDNLQWVSLNRRNDKRLLSSTEMLKGMPFEIKLNKKRLEKFLEKEIVKEVERPVQGVKISQDKEGNFAFDGRPVNGRRLAVEETISALEKGINSLEKSAKIVVKEIKAPVESAEDLEKLGVKELIATGYTTFYGSPYNRQHNIAVGVKKYNGLLLKEGEDMSFNANLGPVDGKSGYRPELVIKGDETIPEYGGGLCQVSTTFYRAALYGGLPIKKRFPHSYAVGYYAQVDGHGLDATIYPDAGKDIIIANDTPGAILIQAYAEKGQIYFHFYGTADGREVQMKGPYISNRHGPPAPKIEKTTALAPGQRKQVERSHGGFNATWYRTVKKGNEEIKETIFSPYRAVPAKYLEGVAGTEG